MLLADCDIKAIVAEDIKQGRQPFIYPFVDTGIKQIELNEKPYEVISYGLTSYGYDVRVGNHFKVFTNAFGQTIDPKNLNDKCFIDVVGKLGEPIVIPPNSFALAHSLEWIRVPRQCLVTITGKSTYARSAQAVPVTPLEPEWEGQITIEISNTAPLPCLIYPEEGIMQLNFHMGYSTCETSYADRNGKYMFQEGIVLPKV